MSHNSYVRTFIAQLMLYPLLCICPEHRLQPNTPQEQLQRPHIQLSSANKIHQLTLFDTPRVSTTQHAHLLSHQLVGLKCNEISDIIYEIMAQFLC